MGTQMEAIHSKTWTLEELRKYATDSNVFVSAFKGIVFDMRGGIQEQMNGNDVTLWMANRWAYANEENCKSIEALEDVQKDFINGELHKWFGLDFGAKILGKLAAGRGEWGFD